MINRAYGNTFAGDRRKWNIAHSSAVAKKIDTGAVVLPVANFSHFISAVSSKRTR